MQTRVQETAPKRVFVLSHNPLFRKGIESLLRQEADLEVLPHTLTPTGDLGSLDMLQPDVVIVDDGDPEGMPVLTLVHLLHQQTDIRVIGVNLIDNTLWIYQGEQRSVNDMNDLMDAIQDREPYPAAPMPT